MLVKVRRFVIKRKAAVRIIALFCRFLLDSQEGIDIAGTSRLQSRVRKNSPVDGSTGSRLSNIQRLAR